MQIIKKAVAVLMSLMLVAGLAGCADTRYVISVDGEDVPAGIYLYYALNVYTAAVDVIGKQDKTFDPTKKDSVEKAVYNGKPLEQYVQDEAIRSVINYVASTREFERLGLSLDEKAKDDAKQYLDYFWGEFGKNLEKNGISKASMTLIINTMYRNEAIFNHYYKEGGEKGITDEDLRKYYLDNFARVKYFPMSFSNYSGEALIGDAKQEVIDKANEYKADIQAGTEFDVVRSEYESVSSSQSVSYSSYSASVSESVSLEEAATGTDENGNTTTAAPTTTPATTTAATTTGADGTSTTVTTAGSLTDSDGNTVTAADTSDSQTDSDGNTVSAVQTTTTTTTTAATTTTDKFHNEIIFSKVTTAKPDEYDIVIEGGITTTTTAPAYTPNKEVHDAIFAQTEYNVPFTVETASAIYIVERYDLAERMTADDLWTELLIEGDEVGNPGLRINAYQQEFLDNLETLAKTYAVQRNDASFKRYVPWKFEIDATV